MSETITGAGKSRPVALRVVMTVLMTVALVVARHVLLHSLLPAITKSGPLQDVLVVLPFAVMTGILGRLVSYRLIDGLWWLVPPVGMVLFIKIFWRITLLPGRDWPVRPNERGSRT